MSPIACVAGVGVDVHVGREVTIVAHIFLTKGWECRRKGCIFSYPLSIPSHAYKSTTVIMAELFGMEPLARSNPGAAVHRPQASQYSPPADVTQGDDAVHTPWVALCREMSASDRLAMRPSQVDLA